MVSTAPISLIGTGFVLGFFHVLTGPDHLSALATLSASVGYFRAFFLGIRWGIGHSTGLVVVGTVFIVIDTLRTQSSDGHVYIPEHVSNAFESLVGLFMLMLGIYGILRALEKRTKAMETTGADATGESGMDLYRHHHSSLLNNPHTQTHHEGIGPQMNESCSNEIELENGTYADSEIQTESHSEPAEARMDDPFIERTSQTRAFLLATGTYRSEIEVSYLSSSDSLGREKAYGTIAANAHTEDEGVKEEPLVEDGHDDCSRDQAGASVIIPNPEFLEVGVAHVLGEDEIEEEVQRCSCSMKGIRHCTSKLSTGTVALIAGIIHGMAGPGGVLGVIPAIQLHNWKLAIVYLGSFCVSSTLTMGCFATLYGFLSSRIGGTQNPIRMFWIECISACLSILVGITWITLLSLGLMEAVFGP